MREGSHDVAGGEALPHLLLPVGVYFRAFLVVLGKCQWETEIVAVVGEDTFCLLCR